MAGHRQRCGARTIWRPRARLAAAFLLALLSVPAPAYAEPVETGARLAQLGAARWGREAGLDAAWVRDIAEGPGGFLWIATSHGLSRFDGRRFRHFDATRTPGLTHSGISALAAGKDGRLWVGLEFGGLRVLRDGVVGSDPQAANLPDDVPVRDILQDAAGNVWVGTERGLWQIGPGGAKIVAPPQRGVADIRALATQGDATWVRTREHGLWRIEGGIARQHPDAPDCMGNSVAVGGGALYTACSKGIWRWDEAAAQWHEVSSEVGVATLFADGHGHLWFGTRQGLARWSPEGFEVRPPDASLSDWRIRAFHQDSRGDLWLGTFSGGLSRLHHGPVRAFGEPEGLGLTATPAVVADGKDVFVGGPMQGLVQWQPGKGKVASWTLADGLPGDTPWALALDPRHPGGLWVAGELGLAWLADGRLAASGPDGVAYAGDVRVLYVDPTPPHSLWLAGEAGGAVEVRPDGATSFGPDQGLDLERVRFFHRDRTGRLLAGGREGLFALVDGRWSKLRVGGLELRALTAITESDAGDLWLASGIDGLVWWSGSDASVFGDAEGMPFLPVHSLVLDDADGLWLSGNDGIARISRAEHARWRQGERSTLPIELLGKRDGLRDAECNGWGSPAVTRLPDGTLVYPTLTGVALLDTSWRTPVDLEPGEIYIDHAWTGSRALPPAGVIALEPGERSLRVDFSAVEMRRPEAVAFRYMLEGFDEDWIPVGLATESNYARLAPGSFRFRLQARLPGMDWVESSHGLQVRAAPTLQETSQFKAGLLLLALTAIVALFAWRRHIVGRHAAVLWQAKTFLRDVIDTSPNPIFARRRDGTYSLVNRAAAALYGREPAGVEGRTPSSIGVDLPGMPALDALDQEVIDTGRERIADEEEIVDHLGRHRWFRVVKRPRFGPYGREVEQVVGIAVDITDFKLAANELRRQEATLLASSAEARLLSRKLLRAQEDERRRLARELHDDLTQRLAGLAMLAWSTLQSLERDPGRDVGVNLRELALELERVANEVQTLARDLHPPALEAMGLAEALRLECATFAKRTGMAIDLSCGELPGDLSPEVSLAIHRIVQEGLRNARNHSGVREAAVRLHAGPDGLHLEVSDAGVGFDADAPRLGRGIGLSSLRERARLAGGRLQVHSVPGQGTRLVVRIPWPPPA